MLPCFIKKQLTNLQLFSFEYHFFLLPIKKRLQNDEFSSIAAAQLLFERIKNKLTLSRNAPFLGHKIHWQERLILPFRHLIRLHQDLRLLP